jgi:hypothetical protein
MQIHVGKAPKPKGTVKSPEKMREQSLANNKDIRKYMMSNHWASQPSTFPEVNRQQRKD